MENKIKDPMELLDIDFSKYNSFAINGVVLVKVNIEARATNIGINLIGRAKDEIIMSISFLYKRKVKIEEIKEGFLSIDEVKEC